MRRGLVGVATCVSLLAAAFVGCNEILDNEPGRLAEDSSRADAERTTPAQQAPAAPGDRTEPAEPEEPTRRDGDGDERGERGESDGAASHACAEGEHACNGVCVSIDDPVHGCGDPSCKPCSRTRDTMGCEAGVCILVACEEGRADCNAIAADGCETDLSKPASCGACDAGCPSIPNATTACTLGACTATCKPGFGDCDATPGNGCEAAFASDPLHCGGCDSACLLGQSCVNGACVFAGVGPGGG